jgi:hypothetical protein
VSRNVADLASARLNRANFSNEAPSPEVTKDIKKAFPSAEWLRQRFAPIHSANTQAGAVSHLIGHYIEGKMPAFFSNPLLAIVAPITNATASISREMKQLNA